MRQITKNAVNAFYNKENFNSSNTVIEHLKEPHTETTFFYLFGNCIATLSKDKLYITNCGYRTNTTKERLNGILERFGFRIYQRDFKWYIAGHEQKEFYNATIDLNKKTIKLLSL